VSSQYLATGQKKGRSSKSNHKDCCQMITASLSDNDRQPVRKRRRLSWGQGERTLSCHRSGDGNIQGPLGAEDCTGRKMLCGMTGTSKLSPLIDPACRPHLEGCISRVSVNTKAQLCSHFFHCLRPFLYPSKLQQGPASEGGSGPLSAG